MEIKHRGWIACLGLLVLVALIAAGCGGGGSSSSSSEPVQEPETSEPETSEEGGEETAATGEFEAPLNEVGAGGLIPADLPPSGLERAEAGYERFVKPQAPIPVSQPITKEIPTGKKVTFMGCGIPFCENMFTLLTESAKDLGWTTENINAGLTPEEISKAWTEVVNKAPDAVVAAGYPKQLFTQQLKQLDEKEIPVVQCCLSEPPGEGIIEVLNPGPQGAQMAWFLTQDTKGKPTHILWVNNKDYPIINEIFQVEFKSEIEKTSPESDVSTFEATSTSYGTTLPNELASYLRSHPEIEYLALGAGPMAFGLPQALRSANIEVPIVEDNPDITNNKQIVNGEERAGVGFPAEATMAQLLDVLARYFAGEEPSGAAAPFTGILTAENIPDPSVYPPIYANAQEEFAELWGK